MAQQSVLDHRPAKRQKLDSHGEYSPSRVTHPGYLCIFHSTYDCTISDTELYKVLSRAESLFEIDLSDTSSLKDAQTITVKTPSSKTAFKIFIDKLEPAGAEFLGDCSKLSQKVNKAKKTGETITSKYLANLHVQSPVCQLEVRLLWQDTPISREKLDPKFSELFQKYVSDAKVSEPQLVPWDVREFYENVHVPALSNAPPLKLSRADCSLYPFQDRATRWMLGREGVESLPSGQLKVKAESDSCLPLDFKKLLLPDHGQAFFSAALKVVCSSATDAIEKYGKFRGGILAEAMGLGKTVEMIALMCTHTAADSPITPRFNYAQKRIGTTLIITPGTILDQWKQEIREHAPSLKVYHYRGLKSVPRGTSVALEAFAESDVVLTTYNVIASEIHYVQEKPDRSLRNRPRREPPKSPLTQVVWWRCLLDEAQMVESGVSNAAIVARLIPRIFAWAVTGTPLKQSHRDLYGLFLFLGYDPWCQSPRLWDYLVLYHRHLLRNLIGTVTLRHSKEQVREELRIPPQSRKVVTIPFTAVEESHYAQMHYDMQQELGLDGAGAPMNGDWDPNDASTIEKMRSWLQRLRQTCLHPEVGGRNRRALGKRGGGPLRTVAQVLDVMIEQNDSIMHTEQRSMLMAKADQARHIEHARLSQLAQDMFKRVLITADQFVTECRADLETQQRIAATSKAQSNHIETPESDVENEEVDATLTVARQRLRSALEIQHVCSFFIGNTFYQLKEQEESKLSPETLQDAKTAAPPDDDHKIVINSDPESSSEKPGSSSEEEVKEAAIKRRIAELENCETDAYETAKKIRTELLAEANSKATRRIKSIRSKRDTKAFVDIPRLQYAEDDFGGIESRKVFEKLYHYCKALNDQAEKFEDVRSQMTELLCRVLVDEEENVELTGEEYEDSTKHQDEMYVLMEILRALFADRSDAISGQENLLLKQETKQFLKSAKEGAGPAPELMIKLLAERAQVQIDTAQQGSLRGILNEIRSLASSLEWQEGSSERAKAELVLVNQLLQHVQKLLAEQARTISSLEQEVNAFRDTMNMRLDYYRALQVISDMVAPIGADEDVGKPADQSKITKLHAAEEAASKKLSLAISKRRYLLHLKQEQVTDGEARICTICQFEFDIGTLTVCGHQFCKECIQMWWAEHRNCPVCKRRLVLNDFYDVTYKPSAAEQPETPLAESSKDPSLRDEVSPNNAIYTTISKAALSQIRGIDLSGPSYGSKVDTLVRHILYLRRTDPGSKHVVFSQYRDFLEVLSRSLQTNDIVHSKFDDKDGIVEFKSNPANECFLLHAKAHAAGLNLVCANHVILCEPLINTAIELQAIARVHRIGQIRETCVWMYLIEGTVEEAIYDISVERRLDHLDNKSGDASRTASRVASRAVSPGRGEIAIEAANAKELQQADLSKMFASGKTGGELVDKEDLWACLFGQSNKSGRPSRTFKDLRAASDTVGGGSEIGRFLRAEAAQNRTQL